MGGHTPNKGIVLQDGLFQATGYGVRFLQIYIGMNFDVKIGFQPPVDFARVNIVLNLYIKQEQQALFANTISPIVSNVGS